MNKLEKLSKPLVDYLRENYNPHTSIVITDERVVIVEDVMCIPFCRAEADIGVGEAADLVPRTQKRHMEIQIERPIDIIREAVRKAIDDIAQEAKVERR